MKRRSVSCKSRANLCAAWRRGPRCGVRPRRASKLQLQQSIPHKMLRRSTASARAVPPRRGAESRRRNSAHCTRAGLSMLCDWPTDGDETNAKQPFRSSKSKKRKSERRNEARRTAHRKRARTSNEKIAGFLSEARGGASARLQTTHLPIRYSSFFKRNMCPLMLPSERTIYIAGRRLDTVCDSLIFYFAIVC